MQTDHAIERLFQQLISGERTATFNFINELQSDGWTGEEMAHAIYWPVLNTLNQFYRQDQLSTLAYNYGTRLLRVVVDQAQSSYTPAARNGRRICLFCGPAEGEDLAAQLAADLLEAAGYEVYFGGAGVANDEIMAEAGARRPDVLLMFASSASDAPVIRQLIDSVRSLGALPSTSIVCGGGVFNRAPGLAEEIGADAFAATPQELIRVLEESRANKVTARPRRRAIA